VILRWVLKNNRMAFSPGTCRRAARIQKGDPVVLYVGRGAYHNPTRDRSQIIGVGTVESAIRPLARPIEIAGREFTCACDLSLALIFPERDGVPVEPLVPRLTFIPRKEIWGQYLRTGLVEISAADVRTISSAMNKWKQAGVSLISEPGSSRL
jgi:hypothetical protein